MDAGEILALLIVGAIAGAAAAYVMGLRAAKGNTQVVIRNIVIGIIGALLGGFLFDLLNIELPEILAAPITVADIFVAFIGGLIVIFVVGLIRK